MKMRKWFLCVTALLLTLCLWHLSTPVQAAATSGQCGESVTWSFDAATGTLTISGTGPMTNYTIKTEADGSATTDNPWNPLAADIKHVVVEPGITTIGDTAFWKLTNVESASLPEGITVVGSNAFAYCEKLKAIDLPKSVEKIEAFAFMHCESLTRFEIPKSMTRIPSWMLGACISLEYVSIPEGVTVIEDAALEGTGLKYVQLPASLTEIKENNFGTYELPWHIFFTGTEAQWNSLTVSWGNDMLTKATVHFGASESAVKSYSGETCTQVGHLKCDLCQDIYYTKKSEPTHQWDAGKVTQEPTCVAVGQKTYTCAACSETKVEDFWETWIHDWDEGVVTHEPTCGVEGTRRHTCKLCSEIDDRSIPATGNHVAGIQGYDENFHWNYCQGCWIELAESKEAHKATVTDALGNKFCACGWLMEYAPMPPQQPDHVHSWAAEEILTPAGCANEGLNSKQCTGCGYVEFITVPKTDDHTFAGGWNYDGESHWLSCIVCGAEGEKQAHTAGDQIFYDGQTHFAQCTVCSGMMTGTKHTPGDWIREESYHSRNCTGCDIVLDGGEHQMDSNGKCKTCGYQKAAAPTEAPKPTQAPKPTEAPKVTEAPKPTEAPKVTEAPKPTEAPKVTEAPKPTEAPNTTAAPETTQAAVTTTDAQQPTTNAPETTVPVQTTVPNVKLEDESSGVMVELPEELAGKLENAQLEAREEEAVSAAGVVESLRQYVSQVGDAKVFHFRLTDNGVQVQPDGNVTVSLPVPQEWKGKPLRVYRVAADGTVTDMGAQLSADGERITFQSDLESNYVLAQVEEGSSLTWLWILLAVIVLAGGGAAGYFFWFKKRKTA